MSDKKVCMLTQEYIRGATWLYALEIARELALEKDWSPSILTASKEGNDMATQQEQKENFPIHLIPTPPSKFFYSQSYWKGTQKKLDEIQPSVIHGNMPMLSTKGVKKIYPTVETVHTTYEGEKLSLKGEAFRKMNWVEKRLVLTYPLLRHVERRLLKKADHLIAVSEPIKQEIIDYYKIKEENITVVPNGVDTQTYQKSEQKLYEKKENEFVLGFLGRMVSRKGADMILDIVKEVKEEIPEVKLLLAGDDLDTKDRIRNAISSKNLQHNIISFGFIKEQEKIDFFNALDVFLLPSNYEGMNLTILEALSCQTCVLSTHEAVTFEHDNTIIIAKRTIKDFAEKIIALYRNPEDIVDIQKRARTTALKYTWKETTQQTKMVYDSLFS